MPSSKLVTNLSPKLFIFGLFSVKLGTEKQSRQRDLAF